MPELTLRALIGLLIIGWPRRDRLGFGQQLGLVLLQANDPLPADLFPFFDKRLLQLQGVGHHQIEKAATSLVLETLP